MRHLIFTTLLIALAAGLPAKSLWTAKSNGERGMFADRLATNIGDILLVRIDEETIVNRTASKNSSSNTNVDLSMSDVLIPEVLENVDTLPRIAFSPGDSFSGAGSVSDANVLEAKIAVLVVDVLPNGNLVVEGARKIEASGEKQYLVVRGIVRGDDVRADNSVMSYNVVNASVELIGEGDINTAQRKGWLNRLLDATNIL